MAEWSNTWTWIDGEWIEGNPPVIGPRSHAFWLGTSVFDGARAFEDVTPDLDMHCARVNDSARALGMKPTMDSARILELAQEGVSKFPKGAELYIRPMYWAEGEGLSTVAADPESTRFLITIYETPMPAKDASLTLTLASYRRPTMECMPVNAKAGCLYPNNARALKEAADKGFMNALVRDALGNIAELATANVFLVKNGVVKTPANNGTFLNGITRRRFIQLLENDGFTVEETTLNYDDFFDADEIFATGNYSKIMPVSKLDERDLQPGPVSARARELYWNYAHGR